MITLKQIKAKYHMPIKRSFEIEINKYISLPIIQHYITKSLDYKLTEKDYDWLYENGNHHGKYQYLNYLCTIYIHPLTQCQALLKLAEKFDKLARI